MTREPEFTASLRLRDGVALVTVAGEADLCSAPLLHDILQQAVATGAPSVVVDASLVSFCDAHGLGILMERERISADQAFQLLRRSSQHLNRKLRAVAQDVVDTGTVPAERKPRD